MSALEKITISLPAEMVAEIRAAVEAGEFANTSEAIRDALRRLVAEGRDSGDPVDGAAALKRLRGKYAGMTAERDR